MYRGLDHVQPVAASLKDAIPFVRKALADEPITSICEPVME